MELSKRMIPAILLSLMLLIATGHVSNSNQSRCSSVTGEVSTIPTVYHSKKCGSSTPNLFGAFLDSRGSWLNGMGPTVVEGRECLSQSHRFRGPCISNQNCANVCHTEGFPDGDCRGFRRRCFCVRPC